jgi:hypothetical protein
MATEKIRSTTKAMTTGTQGPIAAEFGPNWTVVAIKRGHEPSTADGKHVFMVEGTHNPTTADLSPSWTIMVA